jgi:hypothetical protein
MNSFLSALSESLSIEPVCIELAGRAAKVHAQAGEKTEGIDLGAAHEGRKVSLEAWKTGLFLTQIVQSDIFRGGL